MANINCNRKRIRGWPQVIKKMGQLEARELYYGTDWLSEEDTSYTTYSFRVPPFCNLPRRNPPGWFKRLFLESMLRVHDAWKLELEKRGEPYYLALWLYDERFTESELVAAIGGRVHMYNSTLDEHRVPAPRFPQFAEKYQGRFKWSARWDTTPYFNDDYKTDPKVAAFLERKKARQVTVSSGRTFFNIPWGTVWVGSDLM